MGDYQDRIEITHPVSNRLAKYHTFEGVKLIGQLGYEWYTDTLNVKSYDPGTKIMVFTENSLMGIYDTFENNTYLFYNVSEELDHQDEYWFDPSSGVLYVYDPKSDFTLSTGGTFITANGSDFVNVVGMKFICTTGGGFSVSANDFTIDRCLFFGIGARGGSQLYGNRNRLLNSEFRELSGHGVSVSGGDSVHLVKSGNIVDNCLFDTFSQVYRSATQGISCGGVGNTISHCEFVNSPYIAISYGGQYHTIEYCTFRGIVREGGDLGYVYCGRTHTSRGNVIRYNLFENTGSNGFGVYLDDGMDGQELYGNIFYDTYPLIAGGRDNYVCDNVLIGHGGHSTGIAMIPKYYLFSLEAKEQGVPLESMMGSYQGRHDTLFQKPEEGDDGYAEWFAAFPTLYDIIPGYEDLTDPRTEVMPTGCVARRNIGIGDRLQIGPTDELPFCDVGDNADYTFAENPVFVNPTLGDYRIREGSGYLDLRFEKMGRY